MEINFGSKRLDVIHMAFHGLERKPQTLAVAPDDEDI